MKTLLERFMEKVRNDWQWTGGKDTKGYGHIRSGGKSKYAHRVSYEFFNGPIPEGMLVLHDCDDPGCVNPEHLHLGDKSMNEKEAYQRGRRFPPTGQTRGEKSGMAKLTEKKVLEIRKLVAEGHTQASIGRQFGVSQRQVSYIANKKRWGHVK